MMVFFPSKRRGNRSLQVSAPMPSVSASRTAWTWPWKRLSTRGAPSERILVAKRSEDVEDQYIYYNIHIYIYILYIHIYIYTVYMYIV